MTSDQLSLFPIYRVGLRTLHWPGSENNDSASPVRKIESVQNIPCVLCFADRASWYDSG